MNPEPQGNLQNYGGEPTAGSAYVPVWMFTLLMVLLFAGGMYLEAHSGGFSPVVYEPFASRKTLDEMQPPKGGGGDVQLGREKFGLICAGCHQPSGLGAKASGWPPLAGSEWVLAEKPDRIIRIVLHGLEGPIEVNGEKFGSAVMTSLGPVLSDREVAAVLTFVRQEWGNKAPPVTLEQVQAVREATKDRGSVNWTADELKAVPEK